MRERYDIVIIGSGPGGYRAAILAALRGLDVAIVERGVWGGCCLNRGCVPKKDWYHTARLIAADRHLAQRGVEGRLNGNIDVAWDHQRRVVDQVRDSYLDYMKRLKIRTYEGHGRLLDAHTVEVAGVDATTELTAGHVILATGAAPSWPQALPPTDGRILTTDMLYDARPPAGDRVAVVGSGVVATEFAYIMHFLGKEVTWLARSKPLHRIPFSPQAVSTLMSGFADHGIEVTETTIENATVGDDGVTIEQGDGSTVTVDWVLLGTGRHPYTENLGLDDAGITTDADGFIERNTYLQTQAPTVYAIGDCTEPMMTANHALSDASVAIDNIVNGNTREQDPLWVPVVIYSAVELARLGMDDDMAEDAEYEPAIGFAAFDTSPCALGQDEPEGFVRLIGDMDSGELLGGEVIGAEAGELIHLLSLAPDRETALRWLARGTYNHPARGEELLNATETMASKWGLADTIFGGS